MSAGGPDTMTASVPLLAPPTPPLTGESICTMFFLASSANISAATREPVVERSTKRLTRLPWMTPPSPSATFFEICSDGRLAITVSTRSATSAGDDASLRAERHQRRDRVVAGVVDDELVPGLDQPARHRLSHVAESDKADVHAPPPRAVIARIESKLAAFFFTSPIGRGRPPKL